MQKKARQKHRSTEPLLPMLFVLIVTIGTYALSKSPLIPLLLHEGPTIQSDTPLVEFRETYIPDISTPPAEQDAGPGTEAFISAPEPATAIYIEIHGGCGPHYEGACVNARSGPSTSSPAVLKLRDGVVLRTNDMVTDEYGGKWHTVIFDEWIRYPERARAPFYVSEPYGIPHELEMPRSLESGEEHTGKRIVVDRSEQRLTAYETDGTVFLDEKISTGRDATPTPRGVFTVFRKTPSRYMQGPLPGISTDYYDLPGVPWNMYFTEQGGAIHGAYWHDKFGQQWSHGCVNLPLDKARELYLWAELGTEVTIRD